MDAERWRRLDELFHRAVDLAPPARAAFLAAECGDDPELQRELALLLEGDATGDDAVSRLEAHTKVSPPDPLIGTKLGPYTLTARLATGGMGVVYRGERSDGLFRQEVAIKRIRSERATEALLQRFELERRTLAALQHPGIARLYDGGTSADGCPYIVMELVRGEPIDGYCDRERLPLAARLRLFVQVCRAVHFAHQNLVVHCDLKPGNILIDDRGAPRLLDFGIARLLEDEPEGGTPHAPRTIARLLTPEYASPELFTGGPVTTAHDVYSLGVILYELTTDRRPFASAQRSLGEWERLVLERTPERPSTRVLRKEDTVDAEAIAARFQESPSGLRRALRGDLDHIVLMALRKEPWLRYASAQEFAEDVERHLAGLPVRARPASVAYRIRKFVLRNRVVVAAGVAVLGSLVAGLVAARSSERIARFQAAHAKVEADSFQSISGFLMDAFLPAQPAQDAAWQQRARQRVLAHAERVRRQYADADHERANLLDTLGQVCLRLALFADAEALSSEALAVRARAFGPESLEHALSLRSLGQTKFATGEFAAAADLLARALTVHRAAATDTHADVASVANDLAACLRNLGREDEAEALHREALAIRREHGDASLPVAESLNNLAAVLQGRGELAPATVALREALAIRVAILGPGHALTLQTMSNLAATCWRSGAHDEARKLMLDTEAGYRALGGDGEDGLAVTLANLASMQIDSGDTGAAAAHLQEALAIQTKRLSDTHPALAVTLTKLAILEHARRHDDDARGHWEHLLRIRRSPTTAPQDLAEALYGQGVFLLDLGEHAHAVPGLDEALALHRDHALDDPVGRGRIEATLGRCWTRLGKWGEARAHLREAARLFDSATSAGADERARIQDLLTELERRAGG